MKAAIRTAAIAALLISGQAYADELASVPNLQGCVHARLPFQAVNVPSADGSVRMNYTLMPDGTFNLAAELDWGKNIGHDFPTQQGTWWCVGDEFWFQIPRSRRASSPTHTRGRLIGRVDQNGHVI